MPSAVQAPAPTVLRQASPQADAMPFTETQPNQPAMQARPSLQPHPARPLPEPLVQLTHKANLFAEAQRPTSMPPQGMVPPAPETGRPSLFNAVTGAFKRRAMPSAGAMAPQPLPRREPAMEEYQPQPAPVSVQQTSAADQTGLEIPAFLRRQHSH